MLTSIIIPTYNRAHLISRALRNIQQQTLSNWELIIVDDGSTDNTKDVVGQFLNDKRIKYFMKENSGAAESRNVGVANSHGDLITFLDSDDEAVESWLAKMTAEFKDKSVGVVCCGLERINSKGESLDISLPASLAPLFKGVSGRFTNGGVFMMLKEIFEAIGGFDPLLRSGQHTEMSFRLIPYLESRNIRIVNIMEPLIKIHLHDGPRIRHNADAIFHGAVRILDRHTTLFEKNKRQYIVFLSMAGVSAVRTKRYNEAKKLFLKAAQQQPGRIFLWLRWMVSYFPGVRDAVWKRVPKD